MPFWRPTRTIANHGWRTFSIDNEITLTCDLSRRLPHTDPYDRQITIGLGCFVELLALAAAADGYKTDIALFPEGEAQPRLDSRPVARIRFAEDGAAFRDPLFAYVLDRRSNKEAYDLERPVSEQDLKAIAAAARSNPVTFTRDAVRVADLRTLAWDAMMTEATTYETMKESVDLMRIGRAEIEANPDGIDIGGPFIEGLSMAGLFRREDLLDPTSSSFTQQLPILKEPFDTAVAFMWLVTPGNARKDQIEAGRDYIRLNLAATGFGIGMHPFSQALQEFVEMRPHYIAMRNALGIADADTLQMFVRLGYGPQIKAGPRWPYESRIRSI